MTVPKRGQSAYDVLQTLIETLRNSDFPFVELRPKSIDPDTCFDGDYDFLFDHRYLPKLIEICDACCKQQGVSYVVHRQKKNKLRVFLYDITQQRSILLEFWTACMMHCLAAPKPFTIGLSWKYLRQGMLKGEQGFELKPEVAALIYLSHLEYKSKSLESAEVQYRLKYFSSLCEDESIKRIFANLIEKQMDVFIAWKQASSLLPQWAGYGERLYVFKHRLKRFIEKRVARIKPVAHNVVAFVGPDGSGKTSILNRLLERHGDAVEKVRFKHLFRRGKIYKRLKKFYVKPNGLQQNQMDEKFYAWLFVKALPYFRNKYINVKNKKTILLDRFFYDLLVTGLRFDKKSGRRVYWWAMGARFAIPPQVLIVLDLPFEVADARKGEISEQNWPLIHRSYIDAYNVKPAEVLICCQTDTDIDDSMLFLKQAFEKVCFFPGKENV